MEAYWAEEACEAEEARVDVDDEREKVRLGLEEIVRPESRDIWEMERWRAMASYEFFLVCDGERLGITGTESDCRSWATGLPGAMK